MIRELDQLVREVASLPGVIRPEWSEQDSPMLKDIRGGGENGFYLVGLIGGKDVGKSALVNAIVGEEITLRTSHGPGTETVIAYAHGSAAPGLRELLEAEVPGRYRIVEHQVMALVRQVLLDLPDIDSHWIDHVAVTRKMLRHMLFPVWVQSVEKYADQQPQELLRKVADGNAPGNFVFCLNKVDQLQNDEGAIGELRADYAARLGRVLSMEQPPQVWAISATHPSQYEMPGLREVLSQQKSDEAVRASKAKAEARQKASVLKWVAAQDLPGRAERLARLTEEAQEYITDRLGGPLLEKMVPRMTEDALYRHAVVADCMANRVARWPIVGIVHMVFARIGGFVRRNAEATPGPLTGSMGAALVDQQLAAMASPATGRTLSDLVQTSFALLQQSHPAVSELYNERKLWESVPASTAAAELRDALVTTVDRQRSVACAHLEGKSGVVSDAIRFILTIGALVWFPFIQPIVKAVLTNYHSATQPGGSQVSLVTVFVDMLGMAYLLNLLTFFLLYFSVIWVVLRWDTQRRVLSQFAKWRRLENLDPALSLNRQVLDWLSHLLEPVRTAREKIDRLAGQALVLGQSVGG